MFEKTDEQMAILEGSDAGESMKIKAYAGATKTTTCKFVGERRPEVVGLYVAFNKSAQMDADRRMPANVQCRTFNSLGWEAMAVSDTFGFNGVGNRIAMTTKALLKALKLDEDIGISPVKATIHRFTQSLVPHIETRHVPREALARFESPVDKQEVAKEIVQAAKLLWFRMIDPNDRDVQLPHDGYLKLWYHQGGELPFVPDRVFLDEGQDMNPINWGLAERWPGQKFVVGDSFQQIYAFRGAIDTLERVDYPTYHLTQSFRFGDAIAAVANDLLMLDGKAKPLLRGNPAVASNVVTVPTRIDGRHTVLCRTNMGLMEEALELVQSGKTIAVVGMIDDALKQLESAWALYSGDERKIRHPNIRLLGDWDGMLEAAKDDHELALTVRRVEKYRAKIPRITKELKNAIAADEDDAEIVLSTVHKAKGMEWPVVRLADDFPDLLRYDEEEERWKIREDERNLAYVAATRAMKTLHANTTLLSASAHSAALRTMTNVSLAA